MTRVLCIDQNQLVEPTSPVLGKMHPLHDDRGMPRKAKIIDETMFATLLERGERKDTVHIRQIRDHAKAAGMERMSNITIEKYVMKLYGLREFKPSKIIDGKLVKASGFHYLKLCNIMACLPIDTSPAATAMLQCSPARILHHHRPVSAASVVKQRGEPVSPTLALALAESTASILTATLDNKRDVAIPNTGQSPIAASAGQNTPVSKVHSKIASGITLPMIKIAAALDSKTSVVATHRCVEASAWEKAVILKIHENLALPCTVSNMQSSVDASDIVFGVGLGISADRHGFVRINQVRNAPQGTLSMLQVNQIIVYVDNVPVQGKSLETVRSMLVGPKETFVKIIVAPRGNEVVLRRVYRPIPDAFTSDKVVFYGGSKQDRDNCIGILQREYSAYCIDYANKSHIKTVETFSKTTLATSLVVVHYEEKVASNVGKVTNLMVSFNNKLQEEVYALTRCLFNCRFWDDALGPVVFDPPHKIFVFCNQQPRNREEWENWTFSNVSDCQA